MDEVEITADNFDISTDEETPAAATTPRRTLRSIWNTVDKERRSTIICVIIALSIAATIYGTAFTALAIWKHNGRTQAVQRARKMDGEVYTIKGVTWNWIGDTRLFLLNERGEDAGNVVMHNTNPFTSEVNPLYLALSDRRYDPLPFPMKVRAHFKQEAWANDRTDDKYENFTGSFIQFEKIEQD